LAAVSIGTGERSLFIAGVALAYLGFWLDHVDGQVARWRKTASLDGVYFDYLMHHAWNLLLGFALGYGLATQSGQPRWAIAGFAIGAGCTLLSLHNDCRYKAFFQFLKRARGSFRVDGGSGERPAPPAQWPRRGHAALTWPLYKACEYHVMLMVLLGLAILALASQPVWLAAWRGWVILMALLAPLLAIGRSARAILRGTVELDFARWFQPFESAAAKQGAAAQVCSGSHWT
jgi:hypothetical protein